MSHLVSIVMSAYNAEKYLPLALDSILSQSYSQWELIAIDDGSKDATLDILKSYQQNEARIRIISRENKGIPYSLNEGINLAQGDLIARMDADDIMLPNRLEEQVKFLDENPEVSMSSCHAYFINGKGKTIGVQKYTGFDSVEECKNTFAQRKIVLCNHPGFIAYKQALLDVGGYKDIPAAEDLDLFTRMVEQGNVLVITPQILLKYRIHGSSAVANTSKSMLNQTMSSWVINSAVRRQKGEPELTYEDYLQQLKDQPFWKRFHRNRKNYAFHFYKNATLDYTSKNYPSFVWNMSRALVLNPDGIFKKALGIFKNKVKGARS